MQQDVLWMPSSEEQKLKSLSFVLFIYYFIENVTTTWRLDNNYSSILF